MAQLTMFLTKMTVFTAFNAKVEACSCGFARSAGSSLYFDGASRRIPRRRS
jgi:hypothetical protein